MKNKNKNAIYVWKLKIGKKSRVEEKKIQYIKGWLQKLHDQ